MAIKVNVFTKKWLSQQKYRKERDNLKPVGLSLHSKKLNSPIKPRMLIPRKKHPQALDIKYMTCREAACPIKSFKRQKFISTRGTQRHFSAQFVGRRKYCPEISKTWERLACLRSSSTRMKIEIAGIYLLTESEYWEFFLVLSRVSQTTHLPPRKFVVPDS